MFQDLVLESSHHKGEGLKIFNDKIFKISKVNKILITRLSSVLFNEPFEYFKVKFFLKRSITNCDACSRKFNFETWKDLSGAYYPLWKRFITLGLKSISFTYYILIVKYYYLRLIVLFFHGYTGSLEANCDFWKGSCIENNYCRIFNWSQTWIESGLHE